MTEEIMPRKDTSGKVWAFLGGCLTGVIGVFAVAAMSEVTPTAEVISDSVEINDTDLDESITLHACVESIDSEN